MRLCQAAKHFGRRIDAAASAAMRGSLDILEEEANQRIHRLPECEKKSARRPGKDLIPGLFEGLHFSHGDERRDTP